VSFGETAIGATGGATVAAKTEDTGGSGFGDQSSQLKAPINQSSVLGPLNATFLQGVATETSADGPNLKQASPQQLQSDLTNVGGLDKLLGPTG
jgi:hypothetical protein